MYEIEFTVYAQEQFLGLPKEIQKRIKATLERIRIRPESHVKRLVGGEFYRLRVGDYRVIIDIQRDKLIILVIEIGHRRNIYK